MNSCRCWRALTTDERSPCETVEARTWIWLTIRTCAACLWPARPVNEDDLYRVARLRAWGAVPYPMPFDRDTTVHADRPREAEEARAHAARTLMGLARWTNGAYDKPAKDRPAVTWSQWETAGYRPEGLGLVERDPAQGRLFQ